MFYFLQTETTNLANDPRFEDTLKKLRAQLDVSSCCVLCVYIFYMLVSSYVMLDLH